jgi:DNA-binding PucR family transcriptional regulator
LRAHAATLTGAGVGRSLETTAHWTTTVGVGAPRLKLAELSGSYAEAGRSIALGRSVPGLGPLVVWSDLGAYRTLALMMDSDVDEVPVAESFTRLVTSGDASALVPTLEQYLDHAGDARLTADAMFLHKSSLYGRLRRIEEVAGVDLSSGDDRLELHLALRLWRMRGGDCA